MKNSKHIIKTFEHKGQMINYYNKIKDISKFEFVCCGLYFGKGWCVEYMYK